MKSFNTIDDKMNNSYAFTDFLDSLDTDNTSDNELVKEENIDNINTSEFETDKEEKNQKVTALVVQKPNSLFVAQTMFRKSIKLSIKSFLISLSLGFLNLFL